MERLAGAFMPYSGYLPESYAKYVDGDFKGEWWSPLPSEIIQIILNKSWNDRCPVPLTDLAYVRVKHWNFKNEIQTGELLYHKELAYEIVDIFLDLFKAKFPIHKMVLIDRYDADDEKSMEDNNSSAFCFRDITGKPGQYSNHSFGGTIDINPWENPYAKASTVLPKGSDEFLDRTIDVPGMIKEGDACVLAFDKRGYEWGGRWSERKDYQHFEKSPKYFIE